MFGVSPAYFISRFNDHFTCQDIANSLSDLRKSGFQAFQPEVFHQSRLEEWRRNGAARIKESARLNGMTVSQFVAHFLLHAFESPEAIVSDYGVDELAQVLEGVVQFPECQVVTVPMPAFCPLASEQLTREAWASFRSLLVDKLGRMLEVTQQAGRRLALEILPGSLVGGMQGFLRLHEELDSPAFGYNFDTGHSWSAKEWVPLIPAALGDKILGTHLKDNMQKENVALAPGHGTIPWAETLGALVASGYSGSWDIEFRCESDRVITEYEEALCYLKSLRGNCVAASDNAARRRS